MKDGESLTLVLATTNRGKLRELQALLAHLPVRLETVPDVLGSPLEVEEDGSTFEHNATKKAVESAAATGHLCLADDSGLEVDALQGEPGVHSAHYSGARDDAANNAKLLQALAAVPDEQRTARFRCVLALAEPGKQEPVVLTDGRCEGRIAHGLEGDGGFGYDPLFLPTGFAGKTMAELPAEVKNGISHRGQASRALVEELGRYLEQRGAGA